ncbi:MAG: hypothetical protein AB7E24_13955 [Novosphingobium sp.]
MRLNDYRPVPFAIGGVAHTKPARAIDAPSSAKRYGPEDEHGFKPMFFGHQQPDNEAEAQLRLDWEQAAAQMIAKVYSQEDDQRKGALVDLSV